MKSREGMGVPERLKPMVVTQLLPARNDMEGGEGPSVPLLQSVNEVMPFVGQYDWKAAVLPFLFPAIGGLLFGFDSGATSGALISLKDPQLSGTDWFNLSATATGIVVSGSLGGALLGSALAFIIADAFGRRREMMLAALLYLLGGLAMAGAPSLAVLILGRLIYGLGIGLAMHGSAIYIGETAPAPIRGMLVSLEEVLTVGGILLGYIAGYAFIQTPGGWRFIYGSSIPLALLMGVGVTWLPASPRWLLLHAAQLRGDPVVLREQAQAALHRLRGSAVSEATLRWEMEEMRLGNGEKGAHGEVVGGVVEEASWKDLLAGGNVRALLIGSGLVFFQQVTGQPSVLYYAASILQDAGFVTVTDATKVSASLGVAKMVMTLIAVATVDRWGRRPLLLLGVSGMVFSLGLLASFYLFAGVLYPATSVGALLLYVGCYQISFGPISWILVSEIFPLKVRGRALSIATFVNFGANTLVAFLLPTIQTELGQGGTFLTFALVGIMALTFIFLKVPETKGLSLEEIEAQLSS